VLLHFQAVDYDATVWVNGVQVGRHRGGFTPFTCDLGSRARPGRPLTIVVRARDDHRPPQPRGKQSQSDRNYGPFYTRTTGIWQTVWMEPVPDPALGRPRLTPDVAGGRIRLQQPVSASRAGFRLRARLADAQGEVCVQESACELDLTPQVDLPIPEGRRHLWSPATPHLYDLTIELLDADGAPVDTVTSYAGLRGVAIDGSALELNGRRLFQRLVLDQGYYPEGVMTAPSDAALRRDIDLSLAAGFNGARLHQKVFEERFLYHADRLGYLVWAEFGDWGRDPQVSNGAGQEFGATYVTQWLEALARDYSHPCIVGWCPLNETTQDLGDRVTALDDVTLGMFLAAKAMDLTRPMIDASGYSHRVPEADVYDCHDYEQDPDKFRAHHAGMPGAPTSVPYRGQPFLVSEFGGTRWSPDTRQGDESWGYGDTPATVEDVYRRFEGLCGALLNNPRVSGYCYTQLTDVYQEHNGLYTFDRTPKFDLARLRRAQGL
jgi:beta-galactosidase/beta-glucuronidase